MSKAPALPPSLGLGHMRTPSTSGSGVGGGPAPSSLARSPTSEVLDSLDYMFDNLSIVVVGASGDLAKKKVGGLRAWCSDRSHHHVLPPPARRAWCRPSALCTD